MLLFLSNVSLNMGTLSLTGNLIKIFWPLDLLYYLGTNTSNNGDSNFIVSYNDGDVEILDLASETWHPFYILVS